MSINILNQKRLSFDWTNILEEGTKLSSPKQAMLQEVITSPKIHEGIMTFRGKWNIPSVGGETALENDPKFIDEFETEIRKKFGFPEHFSEILKQFVLLGRIYVQHEAEQNMPIVRRIEQAISTVQFFADKGLLIIDRGEINPRIFDFTYGGTTVGINLDNFRVLIEKSPTAPPEEEEVLKPLIKAYQNALKAHHEHYRDRKVKKGRYSFQIDCLIYRAIVEEGMLTNREILAYVQSQLEPYLPKQSENEEDNEDKDPISELSEFKISEKTKTEEAFNKRVQRLRDSIEGKDDIGE